MDATSQLSTTDANTDMQVYALALKFYRSFNEVHTMNSMITENCVLLTNVN